MRFDLAFFLCCCKSFLGNNNDDNTTSDFYALLGVERDATPDELKRAYKRQSLQMHPDKLVQRGETVTAEHQARFTRMKEAYEVLSDPHKRETYDAIGERGMKWLEEPFSIDPQELAHNFATSSVLDRSKIFAIFVAIAVAVFLLPILVCLQVDGHLVNPWLAILIPLWIWNAFILFYHVRVILMGPIVKPEHVPEDEWVDPLPMHKRIVSLLRFLLLVLFEIFLALKLDQFLHWDWIFVFLPLYIWEATNVYKKWPLARIRIVTVEDLEAALGKPFSEFTKAEKDLIGKRYSVVPSTTSPEFQSAQKLKMRARHDLIKTAFRVGFVALLVAQLDDYLTWNWWLIFLPFWILTFLILYANYQAFREVQALAAAKDPTLFGGNNTTDYGAVGANGEAPKPTELSEEEREELRAQVMASGSRLCSKCCSQGFLVLIVVLLVAKLQGAGYSALWIISPCLFAAGLILCCLGFAIFGITEVPTDGVEFDTGDLTTTGDSNVGEGSPQQPSKPETGNVNYAPPTSVAAGAQTSPLKYEPKKSEPTATEASSPKVYDAGVITMPPPAPAVDLLDDCEQGKAHDPSNNTIHELD